MKVVKVTWIDAVGTTDATTRRKAKKLRPHKCCTVGFLLKKTKKYVTVVGTVGEEDDDMITCIPLGWVEKIKTL